MQNMETDLNLVLITDRSNRANMLHDEMQQSGVDGLIRRLRPGRNAINCVRRTGKYQQNPVPDLFIYDFSNPDDLTTSVLRDVAFCERKSSVPVVLLTSPNSQAILDAGDLDGGKAIMLSPLKLTSFITKMKPGNRNLFLKALRTLYQFGPILVQTPQAVLAQDSRELAMSA